MKSTNYILFGVIGLLLLGLLFAIRGCQEADKGKEVLVKRIRTLEEQVEILEAKNALLYDSIQVLNNRVVRLELDSANLAMEVRGLRRDVSNSKHHLRSLKNEIAVGRNSKVLAAQLQGELDDLNTQYISLTTALDKTQDDFIVVCGELDAQTLEVEKFNRKAKQGKEIASFLRNVEAEVTELEFFDKKDKPLRKLTKRKPFKTINFELQFDSKKEMTNKEFFFEVEHITLVKNKPKYVIVSPNEANKGKNSTGVSFRPKPLDNGKYEAKLRFTNHDNQNYGKNYNINVYLMVNGEKVFLSRFPLTTDGYVMNPSKINKKVKKSI